MIRGARAGYQLGRVQAGKEPADWKPMPSVGLGVNEIRVREDSGAFRVIYVAKFEEAVYVLHAFQKKAQKTPKHDMTLPGSVFGIWYKRESSDEQETEDHP